MTMHIEFSLTLGRGEANGWGVQTYVSTYICSKTLLMDNGGKWRGKIRNWENKSSAHRLSEVRSWTWQTQVWTGPDPKCPGPGPAGEWSGPGTNLVVNSPKKIPLKQAKEHIFWTITHEDMDKSIKITENSRCTQIIL